MENCTFDALIARRPELTDMVSGAICMRARAYAPYSNFNVGAMIAIDSTVAGWSCVSRLWFTGCNVENKIYVVTHAEQAAIAQMIGKLGQNPKPVITTVVVACAAEREGSHALPCGFCLQWIAEFGTPQTEIFGVKLSENQNDIIEVECTTLGELMPHAFAL